MVCLQWRSWSEASRPYLVQFWFLGNQFNLAVLYPDSLRLGELRPSSSIPRLPEVGELRPSSGLSTVPTRPDLDSMRPSSSTAQLPQDASSPGALPCQAGEESEGVRRGLVPRRPGGDVWLQRGVPGGMEPP